MKVLFLLGLITAKQLHKNGGNQDGTITSIPISSLVSKTTVSSTFESDSEDYGYAAGNVDAEDYIKAAPELV